MDIFIEELLQLETQRRHALVSKDFKRLAELFSDDLVYVHSTGIVQDKATYLQYAEHALEFLSIERHGLQVRYYGDIAVMSGGMTNVIQAPGLPAPLTVNSHVTQIWNRSGGIWKQVSFQATRSPDTA
ncbi:MAG: nuclear transport factor 2 family protein [Pseudomonadota bacterium]